MSACSVVENINSMWQMILKMYKLSFFACVVVDKSSSCHHIDWLKVKNMQR